MKKVKIMLTAITVMAVVGGALAFKAAKFNSRLFCTTQAGSGKCTVETPFFSIIKVDPNDNGHLSSCTTTDAATANCAVRLTYADQ